MMEATVARASIFRKQLLEKPDARDGDDAPGL
jgi:hypothetical protein